MRRVGSSDGPFDRSAGGTEQVGRRGRSPQLPSEKLDYPRESDLLVLRTHKAVTLVRINVIPDRQAELAHPLHKHIRL